jgi:hypothetical protein
MNDASAILLLLATPGIRPSRIRAVVERHLKYQVPLADLLRDNNQASRLLLQKNWNASARASIPLPKMQVNLRKRIFTWSL